MIIKKVKENSSFIFVMEFDVFGSYRNRNVVFRKYNVFYFIWKLKCNKKHEAKEAGIKIIKINNIKSVLMFVNLHINTQKIENSHILILSEFCLNSLFVERSERTLMKQRL